ncbi:hypothetical protein EVAR_100034_1 [Eumeta japonica]|uniref:Uncharacterized protein n=1 Tax=Eumeta variegata TaxID=151549 RepID=A0A4C1ZPA5_EUMVA|nr:hypothetical protein EVAR_100034_1 [Eumeta japonica]
MGWLKYYSLTQYGREGVTSVVVRLVTESLSPPISYLRPYLIPCQSCRQFVCRPEIRGYRILQQTSDYTVMGVQSGGFALTKRLHFISKEGSIMHVTNDAKALFM